MKRTGIVGGVNGNMVAVNFEDRVMQNEVAYVIVGDESLKAEVIRIKGKRAEVQVFEDTQDISVGDTVEFTGELLSVELGPGLLGQIFDGTQRPLESIAEAYGSYIPRGVRLPSLNRNKVWPFLYGW